MAATITGITVSKNANGSNPAPEQTFAYGDTIWVMVSFSEIVSNPGFDPRLSLDIGGVPVVAAYQGGANTGSNTLKFAYTLTSNLIDTDGIGISIYPGMQVNGTQISYPATHFNNKVESAVPVELSAIAAGQGGFVINGQGQYDYSGRSVAMAGDVNGDGLDDIIVGAHTGDPAGSHDGDPAPGQDAGRSYVVYGTTKTTAVALSDVANGIGGFVINGQEANGYSGVSVAAAGDVNGDGFADVIVGAPYYGNTNAGRAYVVLGKANSPGHPQYEVNLGNLGERGFAIESYTPQQYAGFSVSAAGDFNGDGLADVIVGAPGTWQSFIVLGKQNNNTVALGGAGSVTITAGHNAGLSVAAAGDVNGDGFADVIVTANEDHGNGGLLVRNYVVFGKSGEASIDLGAVYGGTGGFVIKGQTGAISAVEFEQPNVVVAGAGDVNGDGLADLLVSTRQAVGATTVARSFVVFGKTNGNAVDLNDVLPRTTDGINFTSTGGFVINGQTADDQIASVASAGDFNGDGLADLIVSAAGRSGASGPGHTYVVFGRPATASGQPDTTAVDLSAVARGRGGFMINGQAGDNSGVSVSGGGDINGDGLADLIVGANLGDTAAGTDTGRTYVIFGSSTGSTGKSEVDIMGTSGNDTLTGIALGETIIGGLGNDTITGGGGADVIYAGTGNDRITITQSTVTALMNRLGSGGNTAQLARIDGGGGIDTLALDGAGITLDLTKIANQGNSSGTGMSRLDSIERIDLTGSGSNTLQLTAKDVMDIAGINLINSGNQASLGWLYSSSFAPMETRHQLVVTRDTGDVVTLLDASNWSLQGSVFNQLDGHFYDIYNQGTNAQLLVNTLYTAGYVSEIVTNTGATQSIQSGGATRDTTLKFLMVAFPGSTVAVYEGGDFLGNAVPESNGYWGLTTAVLNEGLHNFQVRISYGGESVTRAISATVDTVGWGHTSLTIGTDTGVLDSVSALGGKTSDHTLALTGTVEAGSSIKIYDYPGTSSAGIYLGDAVVSGENWSFTTPELATGSHTLMARFTDRAGNESNDHSNVEVYAKASSIWSYQGGWGGIDTLAALNAVTTGQVLADVSAPAGTPWGIADANINDAWHYGYTGQGVTIAVIDTGLDLNNTDLTGSLSPWSRDFVDDGRILMDFNGHGTWVASEIIAANNGLGLTGAAYGAELMALKASWGGTFDPAIIIRAIIYAVDHGADIINMSLGASNTSLFFGDLSWIYADAIAYAQAHDVLIVAASGNDGAAIPASPASLARTYSNVLAVGADGASFSNNAGDTVPYGYVVAPGLSIAGYNLGGTIGTPSGTSMATPYVAAEAALLLSANPDLTAEQLVQIITRTSEPLNPLTPWIDLVAGNDFINAAEMQGPIVISGMAAADSHISLTWGANARTVTTNSTGVWSYTLSPADFAAMGEGEETISAAFTNPAGQTGLGQRSINIDTIAPTGRATIDAISFDRISGQAENGSIVCLTLGGDNVRMVWVSGNSWNYLMTPSDADLLGQNVTITAAIIDAAGNLGPISAVPFTVETPAVYLSSMAVGRGGFVINGQEAGDQSGFSVSNAGDVNGDGLDDLIIGAKFSDPSGRSDAGRSYVVFGKTGMAAIELGAVANGTGGFVINGQQAGDQSGYSVANAGDINGDGLDDLIIGSPYSDPNGRADSGRSYVVYGKTGTAAIDLSAVANGAGGFVISGQDTGGNSGFSVASAGDVNGDGLVDLIVGAQWSNPETGAKAGRSYLVFGKATNTAVDLSAVANGVGGVVINGQSAGDQSGYSVAGAGDVNGDGYADLIVGANESDPGANNAVAGRSYVVFGKSDMQAINLGVLGTNGFVINGQGPADLSGQSVSAAGDVNGDGLADLIVGALQSDPDRSGFYSARNGAGRSYVVFGKAGNESVDLNSLASPTGTGNGGFVINGSFAGDQSGISVASAGDFNGDGLGDLIVGAINTDQGGFTNAGRAYLVYGRASTTRIELSAVGANSIGGFAINGPTAGDLTGFSVSAAGDINGDGLADLIVGAPGADPSGKASAGQSYVIFGSNTGSTGKSEVDIMGNTGNDTLTGTTAAETIIGGMGDDTITGAGGADVIYAGGGNDKITIAQSTVTALMNPLGSGGNTTQLARMNGGGGVDTLALSGADITLDLTKIANQGNLSGEGFSRLASIERIDITGSGNNTLVLKAQDVLDIADMNQFNSASGWSGLGASVARHQLVVDGNAGDVLQSSGWGVVAATVASNGHTYNVYNQGLYAQLLVNTAIVAQQVI